MGRVNSSRSSLEGVFSERHSLPPIATGVSPLALGRALEATVLQPISLHAPFLRKWGQRPDLMQVRACRGTPHHDDCQDLHLHAYHDVFCT